MAFKFSVGPWNVHEGMDPYGPEVRKTLSLEEKVEKFAVLGISAVQFHDDDVVPNINELSRDEVLEETRKVKSLLDRYGLKAEFVAPRLWMDPHTVDGAFTSNAKEDMAYAEYRALLSIDMAKTLDCNLVGLWLAREGTLCPESKDPVEAIKKIISAINKMLAYDDKIKIFIEPKPNEPVDRSYIGTMGHVMAIAAETIDPSRVGGLVESAHAILAGLDPSNEMAIALALGKLYGVHLNDQNGLKFDQDKSFGVENLRQAFNQIKVLVENDFGINGEYIGLDVKAMRTTNDENAFKHIENSIKIAKALEDKVRRYDYEYQKDCIINRDYEALEMYVINLLMGLV